MAKAKKKTSAGPPVNDPPILDRKGQVRVLKQNSESYQKHRIECFVCSRRVSESECTLDAFARNLFEDGWLVIGSEKFQTIGAMCPRCAKLPDKSRGEW